MADRRRLLQDLQGDTALPPLLPDAAGAECLWSLMLSRVRSTYLPVIKPWPEDTAVLVHDTRVASRRLVEALRLCTPALGSKTCRRAVDRSQSLRRRLGQSREADVVLQDLRHLAERAGLDEEATAGLEALRSSGVRALAAVGAAYPPTRLLRHALDVLEAAAEPRRMFSLRELGAGYLFRKNAVRLASHRKPARQRTCRRSPSAPDSLQICEVHRRNPGGAICGDTDARTNAGRIEDNSRRARRSQRCPRRRTLAGPASDQRVIEPRSTRATTGGLQGPSARTLGNRPHHGRGGCKRCFGFSAQGCRTNRPPVLTLLIR